MNILSAGQNTLNFKRSFAIETVVHRQHKFLFTLLFSLYVILAFVSNIWAIDFIIFLNTVLGVFALLYSIKIQEEDVCLYIFICCLIAAFLVSSLVVGRTEWRFYLPFCFLLSSSGMAMLMLRGYVYSWGGYVVFYSLAAYFLSMMLTGTDVHTVLKYCSWNVISSLMLVACIPLYVLLWMENREIDVMPAVLTFIISVWGIGRAGIASSFVLLCGIVILRLRSQPRYIYHLFIYGFAIIFLSVIFVYLLDYHLWENAHAHFWSRLAEKEPSQRWMMWTNYFHNLDISRILFGVNVVEDPWADGEINAYNYHNSFINLHLQTGLMGLITLTILMASLITFLRKHPLYFILLLALMLRSSADTLIFFGRFDFVPFFFILYFLHSFCFDFRPIKPFRRKHASS